jgi:hypothetical protein
MDLNPFIVLRDITLIVVRYMPVTKVLKIARRFLPSNRDLIIFLIY